MLPRFSKSATPTSRRFFEALAWQACHSCARGGFGLRLPASASLRRDRPPTQRLATVARSRGGFDESTPTPGSATAPTCGELCDPPPTRSGGYPRPRYTPPLPTYHPAPLLLPIRTIPKKKFCPIFGVYLRILPISGACRLPSATPPSRHFFEALAWQASTPAHEGDSAYAFRLRQACAEASRSPRTCDRDKEPRGLR